MSISAIALLERNERGKWKKESYRYAYGIAAANSAVDQGTLVKFDVDSHHALYYRAPGCMPQNHNMFLDLNPLKKMMGFYYLCCMMATVKVVIR